MKQLPENYTVTTASNITTAHTNSEHWHSFSCIEDQMSKIHASAVCAIAYIESQPGDVRDLNALGMLKIIEDIASDAVHFHSLERELQSAHGPNPYQEAT